MRLRRTAAGACAGLLLLATGCSSGDAAEDPPGPDGSSSPTDSATAVPTGPPAKVTLGVYGVPVELAAYRRVVREFNAAQQRVDATLRSYRDAGAAVAAQTDGDRSNDADAFLTPRDAVPELTTDAEIQPVDQLLDERGLSFGDDYQRAAVQAFGTEDGLQCMPYGISPQVLYVNRDLVDFGAMERRGLTVPEDLNEGWNFEELTAAADYAARPATGGRKATYGMHMDPTLTGIAPFLLSAGGQLFDDEDQATSLAFSEDSSIEALEETLPVLRDPKVAVPPEELTRQTAAELFTDGRLGIIAGHRDLLPELRAAKGLDFDVMPMPEIADVQTTADITGMCLSADTPDVQAAADLLAYVVDERAATTVARAGYLVPANVAAAESAEFLQPGRRPAHGERFNDAVRDVVLTPPSVDWPRLEREVQPEVAQLLRDAVLDLEPATRAIDNRSRSVLGGSPMDGADE